MSLVAEIVLEHPDLALSDTLRSDPQLTIRAEHRAATLGAQARFYAVDPERAATFERALDDDHTVADWRLTEAYDDTHLYRIAFSDALKLITPGMLTRDIRILDSTSEGRGWLVRMIAPDRAALESLRAYCERECVSFRLRKLRDAVDHRGRDRGVDLDLTERQREVATVAAEMGYFERGGASAAEVAAALDISKSTLSTHLRAVSAKVFRELFADGSRR